MKNTTLVASTLGGVVALAVGTAIVITATVPNGGPDAAPLPAPAASMPLEPDATVEPTDDIPIDSTNEPKPSSSSSSTDSAGAGSAADIETLLSYLIEEEKLAHDVYVALSDEWGTRIFSNISESESQHQSQVASLLVSYDIDDPRNAQAGLFVNDELQALYDSLMAKGMQSAQDAVEVGILIEETDIRDLQIAIDDIDDSAIDSVLERLLAASRNHLAAFTRQL